MIIFSAGPGTMPTFPRPEEEEEEEEEDEEEEEESEGIFPESLEEDPTRNSWFIFPIFPESPFPIGTAIGYFFDSSMLSDSVSF